MNKEILIEAFDYHLPLERIAALPLAQRDASKLLVYKDGVVNDDTFYHLPYHLPPGSTLILNNTRVIEARIHFKKPTGGVIEIFCLEPFDPADITSAMLQKSKVAWRSMIGGASKWKPGQVLEKFISVHEQSVMLTARYIAKEEDSFVILFEWEGDYHFAEVLHAAGAIPLPPYIKRNAEETDAARYQTVFAAHKGSVAAPTAALHFTQSVFKDLAANNIQKHYITLHVGAGTFKPVKTASVADHLMHAENFSISLAALQALLNAETIIAVGTTSLRTLESLHWLGVKLLLQKDLKEFTLHQWEAYGMANEKFTYKETLSALYNHLTTTAQKEVWCKTSLLIVPGYRFRAAKALVTNFHQPKSTLLLLIAAFIGEDWQKVYAHALQNDYRFLSYGDSSLLWRKE